MGVINSQKGINIFRKESPESSRWPITVEGYSWKTLSRKRRALPRHGVCQHLDLALPDSRTMSNECLFFTSTQFMYCVIGTQGVQDGAPTVDSCDRSSLLSG